MDHNIQYIQPNYAKLEEQLKRFKIEHDQLKAENEKIRALLQRFEDIIKTGGICGENLPVQIAMGDLIEDIKALEGK